MEIFFQSPTRPQSLLNLDDALAQKPWETISALLCALRDVTFATLKNEHRSRLGASIRALEIQEFIFRPQLEEAFCSQWTATRKEEFIINVLHNGGDYLINEIEGAFYKYGGLYGIVALVFAFKTDSILRRWRAIGDQVAQQWLVSNVTPLFSSRENDWCKKFTPQSLSDILDYQHQYLGKHKRDPPTPPRLGQSPLQYEDVRCPYFPRRDQQQQKEHESVSQQVPTPIFTPSSFHLQSHPRQVREGHHDKRPKLDHQSFQLQHGMPSPRRSITSSPIQGLSQHQQLQEKHERASTSPQRCIPSPSSNSCSSEQDPYQKHRSSPTPTSVDSSPSHRDHPSSTSPDSSHTTAVFQMLDHDSKDLATLIAFLGEADIPKKMLLRAAQPKGFFSRAGQIHSAPSPDLNPLFAHSQNLDSALKRLKSLELIGFDEVLGLESIRIQPKLRSLVESTSGDARRDMEYKASLLVFHSFPEDPDADRADRADCAGCAGCANCVNGFEELCNSQLPHVEHVLKYFEAPDFINQFSAPERERIIYSCLSASGFGILGRKLSVLAAAERIMGASLADSLLSAKLRLRRLVLCYLYPTQFKDAYPCNIELDLSPTDTSSNAFLAENILLPVQVMIYRDELSRAWLELENMMPLDANRPEERSVLQKKICFRIKTCLFAGEFDHAKRLLEVLNGSPICRSVQAKYFSYLVSVNCECGTVDAAMETLPTSNFLDWPWLSLGVKGRRASLAAAGTRLMKGLWILKNGKEFSAAKNSLLEAKAIYEALNQVYSKISNASIALAIRQFSVSAGLAMIAHLEWRFPKTVTGETALSYWRAALDVGEESWRKLGGTPFLRMIISYTMCDITSQLGLREETIGLLSTANSLYQDTGRQFHYLALGSIWFDMVQEWNAERGLDRISKLIYKDYMTEQRKGGFPYRKDSIRLCK